MLKASNKIFFLGTGTSQGIPVIGCSCKVCSSHDTRDRRLRTSALINFDGKSLLIDIGPDFRQQMLANSLSRVDAVLLTHQHADHTSGIDDIRPVNFLQDQPIPFYGTRQVLEDLKRRFEYIFGPNDYPGIPQIDLIEFLPGRKFHFQGIEIEALPVMHGQLPVTGFRIGSLAYITDAKTLSDELVESLYGIDCLVLNALHHREHHAHLNLSQALDYVHRINPNRTFLVHLSHHMGLFSEICETLPQGVSLAYDGLQIELI